MNNVIRCPRCALDGREKILGEVLSTGDISIERKRNKWAFEDATLLRGKDFELVCGYCRSVVFYRKEENERSYQRIPWIFRISFMPGTIIQGIQNLSDSTGTTLQS